ncbi:MAG: hypothetical protein ACFFEJ_01245 [Candidatus Thorarchaeota archaeon]
MFSLGEARLLRGKAKKIEQEIVRLYRTIGKMDGLNSKQTEVFAHLKIYDELSQEQLKQLTGFSLSTISVILQSFLQMDIITRRMIPGTHKNVYKMKPELVRITYRPPTQIIEKLEKLDLLLISKQEELRESEDKYPIATKFLHRRLNSLRNYVEAQRRSIYRKKRFPYFEENTSEIIPLDEVVVFPFETKELESKIVDILGYYKSDPIGNRILSFFITHRSLDQDTLVEKTGFSRSTVSRYLREALKGDYINVMPREYRKPRVYYLESMSMSILTRVRTTDGFAFSHIPRFQEILSMLQSTQESGNSGGDTAILIAVIQKTIKQLEEFKNETSFFRQAYGELLEFLGKTVHSNNQTHYE